MTAGTGLAAFPMPPGRYPGGCADRDHSLCRKNGAVKYLHRSASCGVSHRAERPAGTRAGRRPRPLQHHNGPLRHRNVPRSGSPLRYGNLRRNQPQRRGESKMETATDARSFRGLLDDPSRDRNHRLHDIHPAGPAVGYQQQGPQNSSMPTAGSGAPVPETTPLELPRGIWERDWRSTEAKRWQIRPRRKGKYQEAT